MDNHERSQTPNRGAADTRAAILNQIRKRVDESDSGEAQKVLMSLAEWIEGMSERATQKVGGLGRR